MISLVITAAGNSTRFGENKLLLKLGDKPLLIRTVEMFTQCKKISEIIVAVRQHEILFYEELFHEYQLAVKVIAGGKERITSLYNGVKAATGSLIITHDGARPFTPLWLIENLLQEVEKHGAAMTAVKPTATIKHAEEDLIIQRSLPRANTWIAQTPQGFTRDMLLSALELAIKEGFFVATDDSEIVARQGHKVKIVPGDYNNMKVTVQSDLAIAQQIISSS